MNALVTPSTKMRTPWIVASTAWGCRVLLLGIRFWTIPLLLGYLGVDRYAAFSIVASFETWFLLCDFGLGPSIQNFLSETRARAAESPTLMRSMMQLSIGSLLLCALLLWLAGPLAAGWIFSPPFIAIGSPSAFQIAGLCYAATAVGSVAYRVLLASQKGHLAYLIQAAAALVALLTLWIVTQYYTGSQRLIYSLLSTLGIPALAACALFISLFPIRELFSRPHYPEMKKIASRALHFAGFGLINTSILSIDYIIMMRSLLAADIVVYHLFSRLFLAAFSIYALFLQTIWPLCSEWMAMKRYAELAALARRYCSYGLLFIGLVTGGVLVFSSPILQLLASNPALSISASTIALFGVYYAIRVICDLYSMLLQSSSHLKIFFWIGPIQACLSYAAQSFCATRWGIDGIILGLICAFSMTSLWALPWAMYRKWQEHAVPTQENR